MAAITADTVAELLAMPDPVGAVAPMDGLPVVVVVVLLPGLVVPPGLTGSGSAFLQFCRPMPRPISKASQAKKNDADFMVEIEAKSQLVTHQNSAARLGDEIP